jgi:hypothetical protein
MVHKENRKIKGKVVWLTLPKPWVDLLDEETTKQNTTRVALIRDIIYAHLLKQGKIDE